MTKINIIGTKTLDTGDYQPSADELERLQKKEPLLAAVYLAKSGKDNHAQELVEETHRRLKEEIHKNLEKNISGKYANQLKILQEQLDGLQAQKDLDEKQIAELKRALQPLVKPPFSRAILLELLENETEPDESEQHVRNAINALQIVRPQLDDEIVEPALLLLKEKLQCFEKKKDIKASPPIKDTEKERGVPPPYRAVIAVGSGRHEVNISHHETVLEKERLKGCEVWTGGDAMTVIKITNAHANGIASEVVKRLDSQRLQIKGRNAEEFVVQMTAELAAMEDLEAGDIVRALPEAELAFELLEKGTKKLALEETPTESYEDIGGMDEGIEQIRNAIELPFIYRNVYKRYRLKRPSGILLYGPPGCGKTMVAKAIAKSLYDQTANVLRGLEAGLTFATALDQLGKVNGVLEQMATLELELPEGLSVSGDLSAEEARFKVEAWLQEREINLGKKDEELRRIKNRLKEGPGSYFFSIKGPELLSKWVGESESNIRRIFATARERATQETPVVLFFDEMESMFSRRGSGRSSDMEKTIVPQLLAEIDGINAMPNVVVIGASNRYDLIDPAVLRPGRLDVKIRVDRPNKQAAFDIITKYLTPEIPIDPWDVERLSGNVDQAISSLINNLIQVIYNPGSSIFIYRRESKSFQSSRRGHREPLNKALSEVVSGAILANVIERAKRNAAKREIHAEGEAGNTKTGMNWVDDLFPAIEQEFKESKDQYIFEARDSSGEMSYLDADQYEAEVIFKKEVANRLAVTSWARFKERPWI